jgi:heme exporter protein D
LYDLCNQKFQYKNYNYYKYGFFIFAFHGIPTLVLVKVSSLLFQGNSFYLFLAYLAIIISMILISIFAAKRTKKIFPNFYNVLVGARK